MWARIPITLSFLPHHNSALRACIVRILDSSSNKTYLVSTRSSIIPFLFDISAEQYENVLPMEEWRHKIIS